MGLVKFNKKCTRAQALQHTTEHPDTIYFPIDSSWIILNGKELLPPVEMEVIAHALLKLNDEIKTLKSLMSNYGMVAKLDTVDALDYKANGFPMFLTSSTAGAPRASITPDNWDEEKYGVWRGVPYYPNMFYCDIPNKALYYAPICTDSTADWIKL